jgi:hypothetical protein
VASLVFLVVLHKGEYFLSAKILGHQVSARAWEMLLAMLVMEDVASKLPLKALSSPPACGPMYLWI